MPEQQWQPRIRRIDDNERERLQYVRSLMREQRVDEARDELLGMLQQNDKSVPTRLMLASLLQRQEAYAEALDQFKYAIAIDPMHVQAHLRAGVCCLKLNDNEQAKALLTTALDLDAKQVSAHVAMAQVLARTDEVEDGIAHLEEALRLDPQMASARMLMARLLKQSGHVGDAIEELSGFVNSNPDHAAATLRLARMHDQQGNTAKAIELLEAATKAGSEAGMVWNLLGRLKIKTGDYEGAEKAFAEALRLQPQDRLGPLRLVGALIPQRKLDEARELLKRVPRQGRLASAVHQYYGDIYAAQNMHDEAVQSYRAALLHGSGGEQLVADVDRLAGQNGDAKSLVAHYQAAIARMREDARKQRAERGWRPQPQRGQARLARRSRGAPLEATSRTT
jgi:tetratricopeptide (TPR) repeat protein